MKYTQSQTKVKCIHIKRGASEQEEDENQDGNELPFPFPPRSALRELFLKLCMKNMERHLASDRFLQLHPHCTDPKTDNKCHLVANDSSRAQTRLGKGAEGPRGGGVWQRYVWQWKRQRQRGAAASQQYLFKTN